MWNSKFLLIVVGLVLSSVLGHSSTEQRDRQLEPHRPAGAGIGENRKVETTARHRNYVQRNGTHHRATVNCEELASDPEHNRDDLNVACQTHCASLGEEYGSGECVDGSCHCYGTAKTVDHQTRQEGNRRSFAAIRHRPLNRSSLGEEKSSGFFSANGHATVKCEHVIPVGSDGKFDVHKACEAHCRGLSKEYVVGKCVAGVCRCAERVSATARSSTEATRQELKPVVCERTTSEKSGTVRHSHEACRSHCKSLNAKYEDGRCVQGVCRCGTARTEPSEQHRPASGPSQRHPTVSCEQTHEAGGQKSSRGDELCTAHCHSLGPEYSHGDCTEGICYCNRHTPLQPHESGTVSHPTLECERIVSASGRSESEKHEACTAHCRHIGSHYIGGECFEGVCRCWVGIAPLQPELDTVSIEASFEQEEIRSDEKIFAEVQFQ